MITDGGYGPGFAGTTQAIRNKAKRISMIGFAQLMLAALLALAAAGVARADDVLKVKVGVLRL